MNKVSFQEAVEIMTLLDPEEHIPMFIGPPGIGKTHIGRQFCKIKCIPHERQAHLSVALNDVGDIVGYPYEIKNPDGSQTGRMAFATPSWWLGQKNPSTGDYKPLEEILRPFDDDGLEYFLDVSEVNRGASREKQAAMINLFLERCVQGRYLPKRTYIMLSINEGASYNVEDLDPAVRNRIMPFYLSPSVNEWRKWLKTSEKHYNPILDMFVHKHKKSVFIPKDDEISSEGQFTSPRSLAKFGSFLNSFVQNSGHEDKIATVDLVSKIVSQDSGKIKLIMKVCDSILGDRVSSIFMSFFEQEVLNYNGEEFEDDDRFEEIFRLAYKNDRELYEEIATLGSLTVEDLFSYIIDFLKERNITDFSSNDNKRIKRLIKKVYEFSDVPKENKDNFLRTVSKITRSKDFDNILKAP
jgi:hypothetical protein